MILLIGLLVAAYICCLSLADLYLIALHLLQGKAQLARERVDLAARIVPGCEPMVCVQVPAHNEANLIGQAIDALCQVDWPKDRLEIIILDDCSSDSTAPVAARHIAAWHAKGVQVRLHTRSVRLDHKAGLLREAQHLTHADYIAYFDVDCRPDPPILRQLMAVILSDPHLAFVQARLSHRNCARNWLTRAQALELDMLYGYEHMGKNWAGVPVPFAGSQGVWRRRAIEDAGGWRGESLSEDIDLSFRAFLLGWRGRFLATVSVQGELPASFHDLSIQRNRWGIGMAQNLRTWPSRLRSQLSLRQYLLLRVFYLFHATVRFWLLALLALTALCWLLEPADAALLTVALAIALGMIVLPKSTGAFLASRPLRAGEKVRWVEGLVLMWGLQIALLPLGALSMIRGLTPRRHAFLRTPKEGA